MLYVAIIGLAILNVAPLRTPKLSGAWYYGVIVLAIALTSIYSWQLLNAPA
jgi:CDP-diacylglycerol--serine O-phosphatidyltransferase